jgi:hypothetical protein
MTISTAFDINDAVYHASAYGIDKDIIRAIRISGKNKIEYGFKASSGYTWMFHGDGFSWYKQSEVFENDLAAIRLHEKLKAKKEAEEAQEKEEQLTKRKAQLELELKQIEAGLDPDDIEEDD